MDVKDADAEAGERQTQRASPANSVEVQENARAMRIVCVAMSLLLLFGGLMFRDLQEKKWWRSYDRKCESCKVMVDNALLAIDR